MYSAVGITLPSIETIITLYSEQQEVQAILYAIIKDYPQLQEYLFIFKGFISHLFADHKQYCIGADSFLINTYILSQQPGLYFIWQNQ